MSAPLTLWRVLEDFPPYYVRLLAKRPGSGLQDMALTDSDIAILSDIPISRVRAISTSLDWRGITIGEILAFTAACNFDPANCKDRARVKRYEYACKKRNARPFQWLKMSPKYESELLPLLRMLMGRFRNTFETRPTSAPAR